MTTDKIASQDAVRALMGLAEDFARMFHYGDQHWPKYRDNLESAIRAALQASRSVALEEISAMVQDKFRKYENDMEGADHDEFIAAEWAAGAMSQLLIEIRALAAKDGR